MMSSVENLDDFWSEKAALKKLERILDAHPEVMEALNVKPNIYLTRFVKIFRFWYFYMH